MGIIAPHVIHAAIASDHFCCGTVVLCGVLISVRGITEERRSLPATRRRRRPRATFSPQRRPASARHLLEGVEAGKRRGAGQAPERGGVAEEPEVHGGAAQLAREVGADAGGEEGGVLWSMVVVVVIVMVV